MSKTIQLSGTTDSSGDLVLTNSGPRNGFLEKIVMDYDDGATGASMVVTSEDGSASSAILTQAALGTADRVWEPRSLGNKVTDGSAFTNVAVKMFTTGTWKIVIASGGVTKNFRFLIVLSDE